MKSRYLRRIVSFSSCFLFTFAFSNQTQASPNKAEIDNYARANGFPSSDYPYYENVNGCGGEGWSNTVVRDSWSKVSFREACNNHDRCYMRLGSDLNACDDNFYKDLRASCERDSYIRDPFGNMIPDPVTLAACYKIATTYYGSVRSVGWNWHQGAQEKARRYDDLVQNLITLTPQPGSLATFHSACNGDSRSSACVAAIHRACNARGAGGGIAQEIGNGVFGVACFDTKWYGEISLDELRNHHGGCDSLEKSQSPVCLAAIHRACNARGAGGGIAQELGNGVVGVACFDTKWYGEISLDELRNHHGGCDSLEKSQSPVCLAAIHRACNARGAGGGIAQEVGNGVLGVACFDTKWYGDIPIK